MCVVVGGGSGGVVVRSALPAARTPGHSEQHDLDIAAKMEVCAASDYLPRGLAFGPTNGPEDFPGNGLRRSLKAPLQ